MLRAEEVTPTIKNSSLKTKGPLLRYAHFAKFRNSSEATRAIATPVRKRGPDKVGFHLPLADFIQRSWIYPIEDGFHRNASRIPRKEHK